EGEQQIGGIIIPDSAKEKPQRGRVIAARAGKGKEGGEGIPLARKTGALGLFGKYTSQEVKVGGEEYLIMLEDEVLAVIDDVGATTKKYPWSDWRQTKWQNKLGTVMRPGRGFFEASIAWPMRSR